MNAKSPYIVFLNERGIICITIELPQINRDRDAKIAAGMIEEVRQLGSGQAFPFLLDLRKSTGNVMVEMGKLLSQRGSQPLPCLAEALVVDSLGTRLLVNFYKQVYPGGFPSKIFTDTSSAMDWLIPFRNADKQS